MITVQRVSWNWARVPWVGAVCAAGVGFNSGFLAPPANRRKQDRRSVGSVERGEREERNYKERESVGSVGMRPWL